MDIRSVLEQCSLFAGLPPAALERLQGLCTEQELRGGEVLFAIGEPASHLYIIASGSLRVRLPGGEVAAEVGRSEPLGEIGLFSREPHGAEARALRDSLVLRIPRESLLDFVATYPSALVAMTQTIVERLLRNRRQVLLASARRGRALALVAATPDMDLSGPADQLAQALRQSGAVVEKLDIARIDTALGAGAAQRLLSDPALHENLMNWLDDPAHRDSYLLYCAGAGGDAWAECCLRQCDRVLVLAKSGDPPTDSQVQELMRRLGLQVPVDLLLLRERDAPTGDTLGWRRQTGAGAHWLLRPGNAADYASLARQLSGRGLGLVLSGGGARGFAHIGLVRALEELGMPVDLAGGTSMGAFVSALLACGLDSREMQKVTRETFVEHNYLNDYVLPRVSLIRGRKFLNRLKVIFGERRIEDLALPFFCVSTNLTQARTVVHNSGELATWIGTSMAIPGVAPPVAWHGDLLVDGAVTNSLPTDVMQDLGRGPIIASDVSTDGSLRAPGIEGPDPEALLRRGREGAHISLVDILFGAVALTSESGVRMRASRADLYLRMPLGGVALFDWKRLDEIVERGYEHAMQRLPRFRQEFMQS